MKEGKKSQFKFVCQKCVFFKCKYPVFILLNLALTYFIENTIDTQNNFFNWYVFKMNFTLLCK